MNTANFKPRFSLLGFLATVTVLLLGISHWNTSRKLSTVESELRRLRDEVGYISVEDETKFHAVALESKEPNTWRWRLFVPKGVHYGWNIACENIPKNSPPKRVGVTSISNEAYWENDNEVLVTTRLQQLEDGNWNLSINSKIGDSANQMGGATLNIPNEKMTWLKTAPATDGQVFGAKGTEVIDPSGPIILLQKRSCELQPNGSYLPSPNPMPGFMVWLEKL